MLSVVLAITITPQRGTPSWCAYPDIPPPLRYCCLLAPLFMIIVSFRCYILCLLVVLAKLSVLAKWLARQTSLRKPNRGEGIVSRNPRPKSAYDFLGLLYCFIVLLCICVVSWPYMIYFPTAMARCSLFVLKVPLNTKQTNEQACDVMWMCDCEWCCHNHFIVSVF